MARNSSKPINDFLRLERVHTLDLDVTSKDSIDAAVDAAISKFGWIDVLVSNAGYALQEDTESALLPGGQAQAPKVVETNIWGTARLSMHAIRVFRDENPKNGQRGVVVLNVTSLGGFAGFPGTAFYRAGKFAVEGFTESISKEVSPDWKIHFCLIEPGGTNTRFTDDKSLVWLSPHPVYAAADSPARIIESYLKSPDVKKTWTPAERVAAIYRLVARSKDKPLPMRLPLTEGAWQVVKADIAAVNKGLEENKALSISVEVDDANKAGQFLNKQCVPRVR